MEINKQNLILTIQKCIENARELFDEAEILKQNNKYARAYTLYHLASEEIGKTSLVYDFLLKNDYSEEIKRTFLNKYRDHKSKIELSTKVLKVAILILEDEISRDTLNQLSYSKEAISFFNDTKNNSLYTDISKTIPLKPSDILNSENEIKEIKDSTFTKLIVTENLYKHLIKDLDYFIELGKK